MKIIRQAGILLEKLNRQGYQAYVVGGCVRDSLLGKTPQDWDICTSALPGQIIECLKEYPIIKTGIRHGTLTVLVEKKPFEITTFRTDGVYLDHRHPEQVKFVSHLAEDLARRDFTVNAMAYHPKTGLVDLFRGKTDLEKRLIRCVGNPHLRFQEDALRILRALRFASVYGFDVEALTGKHLLENRFLLQKISFERIQKEFCRLLTGNTPGTILRAFPSILAVFLPEIQLITGPCPANQISPAYQPLWEHTLKTIDAVPKDIVLRLVMLFHRISGCCPNGEPIAAAAFKRLRFDHSTILQVNRLLHSYPLPILPEKTSIRRLLRKLGEPAFRQLLLVRQADAAHPVDQKAETAQKQIEQLKQAEKILEAILLEKPCLTLRDLAVNGQDLLDLGIPKGPKVGELLAWLLDLVAEGQLENRRELLMEMGIERYKNLSESTN